MRLTLKITKGKHSPPIQDRLKLWFYTLIGYRITNFQISGVREELGEDWRDWNKLAGRGRLFPKIANWKLIPGQHWRSDRVGWRWNPLRKEKQFSHYRYTNGRRHWSYLGKEKAIEYLNKWSRVNLFPYHGGNLKATQTITFMFELSK